MCKDNLNPIPPSDPWATSQMLLSLICIHKDLHPKVLHNIGLFSRLMEGEPGALETEGRELLLSPKGSPGTGDYPSTRPLPRLGAMLGPAEEGTPGEQHRRC